jgi:UDP-N-acetylmuramoylalanine-D-glutamate ligase
MKTDKKKKAIKKFDLEKMNVAKLNNIHLINGGYGKDDDIKTITQTLQQNTSVI